jgi:DNA-binding response OmpR family regulator
MRVSDQGTDSRTMVLVANGDPMLRLLVRASLDSAEYAIVEASSGAEALIRARDDHPDLIVLDGMMPLCSGPQVLAELRREHATATTPVIMLTARPRTAKMIAGDHVRSLAKPFSPRDLAVLAAELLAAATLAA